MINNIKTRANISSIAKWELLKFECRTFSIYFSKKLSSEKKNKYAVLLKNISDLLNKQLSEEDQYRLSSLQEELNSLYLEKAKGAFVRSRAKWLEFGEKNSVYFFNLEKQHGRKRSIQSLQIDGSISSSKTRISQFVFNFYQKLYSSAFNNLVADSFFDNVTPFIPQISEHNKSVCEKPLTMKELDDVISKSPVNKSPGPDGLPFEFYKVFWDHIKDLLFEALKECIDQGELTTTMKQGLIVLIQKPNKDIFNLDNWRPISLLNIDYKILAAVYANRLKQCLEEVISETQSGFMKNRHISNNIRLILDLLDYSDLVSNDALILFLDFF